MKVTLDSLIQMYPRVNVAARNAISGYIPIGVWQQVEDDVRPEMRKRMLRVYFRGPRVANCNRRTQASGTLKENATHAVIYFRS